MYWNWIGDMYGFNKKDEVKPEAYGPSGIHSPY